MQRKACLVLRVTAQTEIVAILTRVSVDAPIRQPPSSLPTPRMRLWTAGGEEPFQGPVLTAVRQGTAEDGVLWQQASRGSTGGAVHEAVLTVAAEETHGPALQERLQPPPASLPPTPSLQWWLAKATNDLHVTKLNGTVFRPFT